MKNNLIDELFDKSKAYRMGILCSYSLNIEFLENYLLKLDGLSNCTNLCIFTDRKVYNSHFDFNIMSRPRWINKRYLLTPIDTSGVFHPKVYILASEKEVRIGLGSSNLTREGLAGNLEIDSIFIITQKDRRYSGLLRECLIFLHDIALLSGSSYALDSVNKFIEYVEMFTSDVGGDIHLLDNLSYSITAQVQEKLKNYQINSIYAISPFFDKDLSVLKYFMKQYPNADNRIYIQQGKTNFPIVKYLDCSEGTKLFLYKQQERYMHGKAIIFKTTGGIYLLSGSANYTHSAMLSCGLSSNIETSLFGKIDDKVCSELLEPGGLKPVLLRDLKMLQTSPALDQEVSNTIEIVNWLIEAYIEDNRLNIILNTELNLIPQKVIINDDTGHKYSYKDKMILDNINKSDLKYIQIEGENVNGEVRLSSKVWIIDLNINQGANGKKKYYVNNPIRLTEQLRNIIENGTEQDLIDYLMMFDIPLDLAINNIGNKGLKPIDSKGNVFGELVMQKSGWWRNQDLFIAVKYFLENSYIKLGSHYNNIQLNKLGNFMLILGTVFSVIEVINDYIVSSHRKNPLEANDWRIMREYYDLFLEYINDIFELVWLSDDEYLSFERIVDEAIKQDQQRLLGGIVSFKDYIKKMGFEMQINQCYKVSKKILHYINMYLEKGRILTVKGTIVKPVLADNGIKDQYIIHRNSIGNFIDKLINELTEI